MSLPKGFRYASTYAGLRKVERDDLALIVSDAPAAAAAVVTSNRVQAAPVVMARRHLAASRGRVSAVLVNAGNANCATRTGETVALACCRAVAAQAGVPAIEVIPASTGVIGVEMDSGLVIRALPRLFAGLAADRFDDAAAAIMTTDLVKKTAFAKAGRAAVAGMTKGSGMIHPHMATTLAFVMTDAALPASLLRRALRRATARSYNRLSVDGDMSTNDIVLVLANGASGASPSEAAFEKALTAVLADLACQIARDGEGAGKLVIIDVSGASTEAAAERIARAIANSPLVKTAIAGSDPNWGRILAAAGYSGAVFNPAAVDIDLEGVRVCRGGLAADFSEAELKRKLDAKEVSIRFHIRGGGNAKVRFWTCDLTHGYIDINASYRT